MTGAAMQAVAPYVEECAEHSSVILSVTVTARTEPDVVDLLIVGLTPSGEVYKRQYEVAVP